MSGVRNPYRGQLARPVQPCQAGGVATIGLDPVAGSLRDQRWRNDDTVVPAPRKVTLNSVAARPRLVAEAKPHPFTAELARHAIECRRRVRNPAVLPYLAADAILGYRHNDPLLVNVQTDIRDTIPHDPSPMHEARYRPIRCNPRYLHTVRRVAPYSGGHVV